MACRVCMLRRRGVALVWVTPEAIVLLIVRTQMREKDGVPYEVRSPLHLCQCSHLPRELLNWYTRTAPNRTTEFWRSDENGSQIG